MKKRGAPEYIYRKEFHNGFGAFVCGSKPGSERGIAVFRVYIVRLHLAL